MEKLTPEMLERLKELHEKATEAGWYVEQDIKNSELYYVYDGNDFGVATASGVAYVDDAMEVPVDKARANANLIAEGRNALPLLLTEIARLQAEVREYRDGLKELYTETRSNFLRHLFEKDVDDIWYIANAKSLIEKEAK